MSNNVPATCSSAAAHDSIDLGQLVQSLRRRAGLIAAIMMTTTVIALLHAVLAEPQFTVKGALYLGDAQGPAAAAENNGHGLNFLGDYSNGSDVETQIELITAGALVKNAVLETGLNAQISPAGTPRLTYWRWRLFNHGDTSSFTPGPDTLEALYATTPGRYKLVIGQNDTYKLYVRRGLFEHDRFILDGRLGQPAAGNGVQLVVKPAGEAFQAVPEKEYDLNISSPDVLASALQSGALTVSAGGSAQQPTQIAFLQFGWANPYQAQRFLNQVMQDYIATQLSWKTQSASTTEDFVSNQLKNISTELAQADQNLASYQSQTGILDVPQNEQTIINQLAQYQTQRTTLQLQRDALGQLAGELKNSGGQLNPYLVSQTNDTVLSALTTNLSNEELKLSNLQAQFTGASQNVQIEEAQVTELEEAIRDTVNNDLAAANKNLANLDQIIGNFQSQKKQMPAESLKVIALQRSTDVLGQLYVLLMEKQEEAQVSKAATIINTRIVTPADMPLKPTSPKVIVTVLFGALVGLVIGVGLTLGRRAFSGCFESEEQIRSAISRPIYAAIPRQLKGNITASIFGATGRTPFSEAFRILCRSIYLTGTPDEPMVILIISPSKEDGKTTVAVNLAKTLSANGKRVVLVDGDVHLSRLRSLLRFGNDHGLVDWLASGIRPELHNWPHQNFKFLPAGAKSLLGHELLNEERLHTIFWSLRADFDYVIIDSPPLPTVSDGLILGSFADLILSVVSVSHTSRRALNVHNELIDTLKRPHGIIINEVEPEIYGGNDTSFFSETMRREKCAGWFTFEQS
ncbi:GumC family protein [Acidocella aromatica]|nr:GNVR domain-containing protein [Acidocella aromatica]